VVSFASMVGYAWKHTHANTTTSFITSTYITTIASPSTTTIK
jgi:hypothetical protein